MMTKDSLEKYLLKNIPISSAIGIQVELATLDKIVLSAPFSNNINHKKTVFGGSLHAVATLAGWCLVHVNLDELYGSHVQIVIANSEVKYLLPVLSDFKAECVLPDFKEWDKFLKTLQKKGKARLQVSVKIFQESKLAVDYSACFVAIRI